MASFQAMLGVPVGAHGSTKAAQAAEVGAKALDVKVQ